MTGSVAILIGDDRMFGSRALLMARAAQELGLEATVITPASLAGPVAAQGLHVIPIGSLGGGFNPLSAGYAAGQLASVLKLLKPDLVHCIGLRSILLGGAASAMAGIDRRVYTIPGLGDLGARTDLVARAGRWAIRSALKGPLLTAGTRFVVEKEDDAAALGLDPGRVRVIGREILLGDPVPDPPMGAGAHTFGISDLSERQVMDDTKRLYAEMLGASGRQ